MPLPTAGETRVLLDISEVTVSRQGWSYSRTGSQIGWHRREVPSGAPTTHDVLRTGGDTYILRPRQTEFAQTAKTAVGGAIPAADVNVADSFESAPWWKVITDLAGIGADAGLASTAGNAFIKRAGASDAWSSHVLSADATAFAGPTQPLDNAYPLDRVIAGKVSYEPNTPFMIKWGHPREWVGTDAFVNFYFGGQADTKPVDSYGGEWCLSLRGGGTAALYERKANATWAKRYEFQWAEGSASSFDYYVVMIIPHGRNRIAFFSTTSLLETGGGFFGTWGLMATAAMMAIQTPELHKNNFSESYADTGHYHTQHASGAGIIRGDIRRDFRIPLTIVKCDYPATTDSETGVIVDAPFQLRENYPAATAITAAASAAISRRMSIAVRPPIVQ
jgi:hypothetical protein